MTLLGIENLWLFLATSIILIISPGLDTMLILNRSITNGKAIGISCTLGIVTGILVHTLFGVLGVSIILSEAAYLFTALKMIGAAYLIYLGVMKLIKRPKKTTLGQLTTEEISHRKSFVSGLITNVFNPKVALFFLAFFPQFINPSAQSPSLSFLAMGIIFTLISLVWLLLLTLLISYFSKIFLKSTRAMKIVDKLSGIVFLAMGLKLALTSRK